MSTQDENSVGPHSPDEVGEAFTQQYYRILNEFPEYVHKFYHEESILGRPAVDGSMTYITTSHAINEQILSSDLRHCVIELENVDTQPSLEGGVLVLVTGSFTTLDALKHRFTQSFFLAPQENGGYFVLNDMLRHIPETPSAEANESLANHVDGINQIASFPAEPETASVRESAEPKLPSGENILVNDEVINPHAQNTPYSAEATTTFAENMSAEEKFIDPSSENISVKEKVINTSEGNISEEEKVINTSANGNAQTMNDVETSVAVVSVNAERIPVSAPASPASAQKDVIKKTYASIVKNLKDNLLPPPVANPKSKPKPTVQRAEIVETSASSTVKPTLAADTTPPNEKNVSNGQGYSVFVKNLPSSATVEMVEDEFKKFGAIKSGGIQVRHHQLDHFCYGFVEFELQESVRAALEASPVLVGSKKSYVEEKRTSRRVVNAVVTHGHNNGNTRGNRIQPAVTNNGNYPGGNNSNGKGAADIRNNSNYRGYNSLGGQGGGGFRNHHNGDSFSAPGSGFSGNFNTSNGFRSQDQYSGRGRRPYPNGHHQNGTGYHQSRPLHSENGNGSSARANGSKPTPDSA